MLSKEVTARPGRYRADFAPYQQEPQESFTDAEVQTTVLCWASRLGKTEIELNLIGQQVETNPRNILVCYPTQDSAKKWSKQFLSQMIRSTPSLRGKFRESRTRDANNTIFAKAFPGGTVSMIGSNSPTAFRQVQCPVVICDEIDAMENGPEGDPVALAFKRAENYHDSVQVVSSTPTIKGMSRIEYWLEQSDFRQWFVPCKSCGHEWAMKWGDVQWPEGKPKEARIICPKCQAAHDDASRLEMIRAGKWVATRPFNGIRGYWLNGLNTVFLPKKGYESKLHQIASEFLEAKHAGTNALKVWTNTFLAESWEEDGESISADETRCEDYEAELPRGVLLLSASADVQKDRIEAEVVGYGDEEESWGIERVTLVGNTEQMDVWRRLGDFFQKEFRHADGYKLRPAIGCVDSGFATKQALAFVQSQSPRMVFAVKGTGHKLAQPVLQGKRASRDRSLLVDISEFKSAIYSRLKIKEPGPRFMHFPKGRGYDDEFFKQLTAEKVRTSYHFGNPKLTWENVRANRRNEALDIRVYSLAGLFILRPVWAALKESARRMAEKFKASQAAPIQPQPQEPRRFAPRRFNEY